MNNMKKYEPMRLPWLDAAKGIGIIFVVMGHIVTDPLLGRFIYSFHMPLFFFLSGIAFNFSRQEQFIRRHARSLLLPYFTFCILSFLYWFLLERHFRPSNFNAESEFLNIFIAQGGKYIFNSVMWFLPCLFVIETWFHVLRKNIRSEATILLVAVVFAVAGFMLSGTEPFPRSFRLSVRLPWMLDTAMISIGFYALGAALGGISVFTISGRMTTLFFIMTSAFALCFGVAVFFSSQTNLAEFILPNPAIFFVGSCSGIAAIIAAAKCIPASWLQALGSMSLVIMCIHEPLKRVLLKIAEIVSGIGITELRAGITTSIVMTAITLLVCIPPALIIRRFFPWFIGKGARR